MAGVRKPSPNRSIKLASPVPLDDFKDGIFALIQFAGDRAIAAAIINRREDLGAR
jgi:hypothetical protein